MEAELQASLEAIIYLAHRPLSQKELHQLIDPEIPDALFEETLQKLKERYKADDHGIELIEVAGGYQFRTKPGKAHIARKLVKIQTQKLSTGALETLAIIAYKQPILKEQIDQIRGVDSSYFLRNLLDKKLVHMGDRSELPGRPILYKTTDTFLEVFGLKDLSSLPPLRELEQMIPSSETDNPEEDPQARKMRQLLSEMKMDRTAVFTFDSKDEEFLKTIRERVQQIQTSSPTLDAILAGEDTTHAPS